MRKWKDAVALLIFTALLICVLLDDINVINTNSVSFDPAYNAQVARHFAETGKYAVTYPEEIVFYNAITTGPTLLTGTALLYKIFGISNFSANLIPMLYGIGVLILLYLIFIHILKTKWKYIFGLLGIFGYLGFTAWFQGLSTNLLGEVGALFFTLLSVLLMIDYYENNNDRFLVLAGVSMAFSLVSKTSQIVMILVFPVILFWDFWRKEHCEILKIIYFLAGFLAGIFFWEIFKIVQFQGDILKVFQWWVNEKNNIFNQTKTESLFSNFEWEKILDRWLYLQDVFSLNYAVIFIVIAVPFICFAYYYFVDKKENRNAGMSSILLMGISGESLLVYFVLFGSEGLKYARRLSVYSEIVVISCICLLLFCLDKGTNHEGKKLHACAAGTLFIVCIFLNFERFTGQIKSYAYKNSEMSVDGKSVEEMKNKITSLPSDAEIYTYGWWQAPEISLFVNDTFQNIEYSIMNKKELEGDNNYFLIGSLISPPWDWEGNFLDWLGQYYELSEIFHSPSCENTEIYVLYKMKDKENFLE